MPLLFAAAPALVPCPSASLPDAIVAPALVPCPLVPALACHCGTCPLLVSVLACRRRHAGCRPLPVSVCPRLPSLSPLLPPMAADAPGRSLPSAAALTVLPPPLPSLQPPSSSPTTIIVATKPSLPPPPLPNLVLFGRSTFSRTEESSHQEEQNRTTWKNS
jgi:hypothetical protein